MNSSKLRKSYLRDAPEILDTVNVSTTVSEFVVSMVNPIMLFITEIYQAVVGSKAISVHGRAFIDFLLDYRQNNLRRTVLDYLSVHLTFAFNQTKYNGFTARSSSPDSSNSTSSKVRFIQFDFSHRERTLLFTMLGNSCSNSLKNLVYTVPV